MSKAEQIIRRGRVEAAKVAIAKALAHYQASGGQQIQELKDQIEESIVWAIADIETDLRSKGESGALNVQLRANQVCTYPEIVLWLKETYNLEVDGDGILKRAKA